LAFHSGREADHSPPSSAEVKECVELYLHSPNTPSWRGAQLEGAQGQLYLYLIINLSCFKLLISEQQHIVFPFFIKDILISVAITFNDGASYNGQLR
jgi:hypothetical protein